VGDQRVSKVLETFQAQKSFIIPLRPAYSVKLVVSCVVKGLEIKRTAKFHASRRLRFEDAIRVISPKMRPKSFGTFEKRACNLAYIYYLQSWAYLSS